MIGANVVVGTAGHIDHGKTSLVRALTGVDLDTLPEEQQRGITIALGFAPFDLPGGGRVAFVDVPGHERLVKTMIAGATGIDAVLLCVSAVDGAMPQTREHLAILDLLGIEEGCVVLTMADLVDDELLSMATLDVGELVDGTFLEDKPVVPFSSVTGLGRDRLVEVLGSFVRRERALDGPFRLPIDRAFTRPGFGAIATGTAWSGRVREGDEVTLLPGGDTARVRGIEVHGASATEAQAGWRVALNLAGAKDVSRGMVVTHGPVPSTQMLDVVYTHLASAEPLPDDVAVRLLHGTTEAMGRLHVASDTDEIRPGDKAFAQIRLDAPVPCLPGDRFVVRRPSPEETLGGGVVLDPWAPRMKRSQRSEHGEALKRLHGGDRLVLLERAGETGLTEADRVARGVGDLGVRLGDRVFAPRIVARLEGALLEALVAYHAEQPLALGAHRRELRRERLAHLEEPVFDALVDRLAAMHAVELHGPLVCRTGHRIELSDAQRTLMRALREQIENGGIEGVAPEVVHKAHPEPEVVALLKLLETEGLAVQVPKLGWVARGVVDDVLERLRGWFHQSEQLTPPQFKELVGLTRKGAIPWLEWLDKERALRRMPDGTRLPGPALSR